MYSAVCGGQATIKITRKMITHYYRGALTPSSPVHFGFRVAFFPALCRTIAMLEFHCFESLLNFPYICNFRHDDA